MKKANQKNSQKPFTNDYTAPYKVANEYLKKNESIIYLREAIYPVLNLDVIIREKSREQLGDIEKSILSLTHCGLISVASIAEAMGIKSSRMQPFIDELVGRGLLISQGGQLAISDLGKISLQLGVEVLDVHKSLLLSGLDGSLLPEKIYRCERLEPNQLSRNTKFRDFIDPETRISLSALDLTTLTDRRAYNIPDEAMCITAIEDKRPVFIKGLLMISATNASTPTGRFITNQTSLEIVNPKDLLAMMEPLGFSKQKEPRAVLNEIVSELEKQGVYQVIDAKLDSLGNPEIKIDAVTDDCKALKSAGMPFIAFLGTQKLRPVPLNIYPLSAKHYNELLNGRTMKITTLDPTLSKEVEQLRFSNDLYEHYISTPAAKRQGLFIQHLCLEIERQGWDLNEVRDIVLKTDYTRISRHFNDGENT